MATSLVAAWLPLPVLSPTRQPAGNPLRRRAAPVVLARSHSASCSRDASDKAVPSSNACRLTRSEEHTSELQSLMRISYAVFCLNNKKKTITTTHKHLGSHNNHRTNQMTKYNKHN